jgi:hypothetical protein
MGARLPGRLKDGLEETLMTYWLGILLEYSFVIGTWALLWAARKLIREEKQISNPDRSFYRRNDSDFFRLIFILYFGVQPGPCCTACGSNITEHNAIAQFLFRKT